MTTSSHAIITGGSSGIGREVARLLVARGTAVTLLARRPVVLDEARDDLARTAPAGVTPRVHTAAVDVSDAAALAAAIAAAERAQGPCDALVASAGIAIPGYFEALPLDVFERTMAVNYFGALHAVRAIVPGMRARRRGRIVLVGSGAGIVGVYGYAAYSPTKFALRGLAEVLRAELAPEGIRVSIVYPPDTDTPQLAEENLTKPAETRAITAGAQTWPADGVARKIVTGMDQGRFAITPGWEMTILHRLHSMINPALAWHFDRQAARAKVARRD
jgi:short-subunit dehydrogenase